MLEILQYLQLPHPFQSSIIKTVQEAAITYAFVSDQLLSTMQFVENNKEAIEENESEPKISTQNLNFLIKFTNAVVSLKYADFQSVPETAYELYKICLTILQTLKTENVCLAVKIYS